MFLILWEYEVEQPARAAFELEYGGGGAWSRLFQTAAGFLGTRLYRQVGDPSRYLTTDSWVDRAAYARFMAQRQSEYQALDEQLRGLSIAQRRLGEFESAPSPNGNPG